MMWRTVVINVTSDQDDGSGLQHARPTIVDHSFYGRPSGGYQCKSQSVPWEPLTSRWFGAARLVRCLISTRSDFRLLACLRASRRQRVVVRYVVPLWSYRIRRRHTAVTGTLNQCPDQTISLNALSQSNLYSNLPDADATSSLKADCSETWHWCSVSWLRWKTIN